MEATFVSAVALLLVRDPFGNVPIFISARRDVPHERRRIILRKCLIAFGVLTVFVSSGQPFMRLLGLSELSLQTGGAVVLMLVAIWMVCPTKEGMHGQAPGGQPFIVPLAVPALAGPSALATVLLLLSSDPARARKWVGAIAVVMAVSALILAFAEHLQHWLGERVIVAFERVMGLILTAIAVALMLRGIKSFVAGL